MLILGCILQDCAGVRRRAPAQVLQRHKITVRSAPLYGSAPPSLTRSVQYFVSPTTVAIRQEYRKPSVCPAMGEKVTACTVDMKSERQQVEHIQYSK